MGICKWLVFGILVACGVIAIGLLVWLLLPAKLSYQNDGETKRPHIVFILADDLGWNDVSFHGWKQVPTPNIDAIALDGVILNRYYVGPACTPSRAALMTAKYPVVFGLHNVVIKGSDHGALPLEEEILPEYLKSLGYSTHGIGKWNLGHFKSEYLPMNRGFDSFFGFWTPYEDYFTHVFIERLTNYTGYDLHDNFETAYGYDGVYGTDLITNKAREVISNHDSEKPLFLYVSQQAPHGANSLNKDEILQVPDKYIQHLSHIKDEKRLKYGGMVSALDHSVGEIFGALQESGMLDDSIVIFSTDNGANVNGMEGTMGTNFPLKGGKGNLWEGGVRGLSFIWSPLLRNHSRVSNDLMYITDWLPTLLSAAGASDISKIVETTNGVNMWPTLFSNAPAAREELLLNINGFGDSEAYMWKNYKLLKGSFFKGRQDVWSGNDGKTLRDFLPEESQENLAQYEKVYKKSLEQSKAAHVLQEKYGNSYENGLTCKIPGCGTFPDAARCGALLPGSFPPPSNRTCNLQEDYCLFDVAKDPCEYNNIIDEFPEVVEKLKVLLDGYRKHVTIGDFPSDPDGNPQLRDGVWNPWM